MPLVKKYFSWMDLHFLGEGLKKDQVECLGNKAYVFLILIDFHLIYLTYCSIASSIKKDCVQNIELYI